MHFFNIGSKNKSQFFAGPKLPSSGEVKRSQIMNHYVSLVLNPLRCKDSKTNRAVNG